MMPDMYQRDDDLRRRFNDFLHEDLKLDASYCFESLTVGSILKLKSILSDINNTVTMWLTLGFVDSLRCYCDFNERDVENLRKQVLAMKPNSNGYDVFCKSPRSIIAEVKCNVPINGGRVYGAAQKRGIIRDVESLLHGKSKSDPVPKDALKFMVFLDSDAVRAANKHLKDNPEKIFKNIRGLEGGERACDPGVVYEVYISLDKYLINNSSWLCG